MYYNTISQRYKRAFDILKTLPFMLLGITVLAMAIMFYAYRSVVLWIIPFAVIPVGFIVSVGLCSVFLKAARDEKYDVMDLFVAVKDWQTLKHVVGGMLWMMLMIYLWSLIPAIAITVALFIFTLVISFVFDTGAFLVLLSVILVPLWIAAWVMAIVKAMEFSFTPYILISRPEIKAVDAVKESSRLTKGIKGRIFGAITLPSFAFLFVMMILGGLSALPLIGWLFAAAAFVLNILFSIIYSLFSGLVMAGFYTDAVNPPPPPPQYNPYNQQYYNQQYYQYYQQPAAGQQPQYQPQPQPQPAPAPQPTPAPAPESQPAPEPPTTETPQEPEHPQE